MSRPTSAMIERARFSLTPGISASRATAGSTGASGAVPAPGPAVPSPSAPQAAGIAAVSSAARAVSWAIRASGKAIWSLAGRYPARVHFGLGLNTGYVSLNTRLPPFTNIRARQAVNYAIDRARIIQLADAAPVQAAATCQMLPPDFPGYRPYCPYTAGTGDGAWHSPDMAKARRLVRESGTTNVPVTVWSFDSFPGKAAGSYLVGLLDDLGYRASLHAVPDDRFWTDIDDPRLKIQVSFGGGWGADFPTPSTFFGPLLSCQ